MDDGGHIFKKVTRFFALPKEGEDEGEEVWTWPEEEDSCLLYTSDAADEL